MEQLFDDLDDFGAFDDAVSGEPLGLVHRERTTVVPDRGLERAARRAPREVCIEQSHIDRRILAARGLREGANSEPKEYVVEKAFVGDGI